MDYTSVLNNGENKKYDTNMSTAMSVGIVGCGAIGSALKTWIENNNKDCKILILDPPKGCNDDLSHCDAIFVSIHVETKDDNTQELELLNKIISSLPNKPIFIRTTLLPGTCDSLAKKFNKEIYFMPEFLTERTAEDDFTKQKMIFCGRVDLLKKIFINKDYIEMSNTEAELAKYAHNVFGALKVTYFNGIYEMCQKINCDYSKVREGTLLSGYINEPHTMVPGPDGKFGYGGKCFPKDQLAFTDITRGLSINKIIEPLAALNRYYREK